MAAKSRKRLKKQLDDAFEKFIQTQVTQEAAAYATNQGIRGEHITMSRSCEDAKKKLQNVNMVNEGLIKEIANLKTQSKTESAAWKEEVESNQEELRILWEQHESLKASTFTKKPTNHRTDADIMGGLQKLEYCISERVADLLEGLDKLSARESIEHGKNARSLVENDHEIPDFDTFTTTFPALPEYFLHHKIMKMFEPLFNTNILFAASPSVVSVFGQISDGISPRNLDKANQTKKHSRQLFEIVYDTPEHRKNRGRELHKVVNEFQECLLQIFPDLKLLPAHLHGLNDLISTAVTLSDEIQMSPATYRFEFLPLPEHKFHNINHRFKIAEHSIRDITTRREVPDSSELVDGNGTIGCEWYFQLEPSIMKFDTSEGTWALLRKSTLAVKIKSDEVAMAGNDAGDDIRASEENVGDTEQQSDLPSETKWWTWVYR